MANHTTSLSICLAIPAEINPNNVQVRMAGTPDDPLWCLADTCLVLGNLNSRQVASRIDSDDVHTVDIIDSLGRTQSAQFVNESGLYQIVLTSRAENAKPFRKWVCGTVLPCIRKHGCYPAPKPKPVDPALIPRPWSARLDENVVAFRREMHSKHPGWWSVVTETMVDLFILEDELLRHGFPLSMSDLPDGSIGKLWSDFRFSKPWSRPPRNDCRLVTPHGFACKPCIYHSCEVGEFQRWLHSCYIPEQMPEYLERKVKNDRKGWLEQGRHVPQLIEVGLAANTASQRIAGRDAELPHKMRLPEIGQRQRELFA